VWSEDLPPRNVTFRSLGQSCHPDRGFFCRNYLSCVDSVCELIEVGQPCVPSSFSSSFSSSVLSASSPAWSSRSQHDELTGPSPPTVTVNSPCGVWLQCLSNGTGGHQCLPSNLPNGAVCSPAIGVPEQCASRNCTESGVCEFAPSNSTLGNGQVGDRCRVSDVASCIAGLFCGPVGHNADVGVCSSPISQGDSCWNATHVPYPNLVCEPGSLCVSDKTQAETATCVSLNSGNEGDPCLDVYEYNSCKYGLRCVPTNLTAHGVAPDSPWKCVKPPSENPASCTSPEQCKFGYSCIYQTSTAAEGKCKFVHQTDCSTQLSTLNDCISTSSCPFDPTPLTGQSGFANRGRQDTCITSACQFQHHKVLCCQNRGLTAIYTPAYAPKHVCHQVSFFSPWGTVAICMAISLGISFGVVGFNVWSKFRRRRQARLQAAEHHEEEEEEEEDDDEDDEEDDGMFSDERELFDPTLVEVISERRPDFAASPRKHATYGSLAITETTALLGVPPPRHLQHRSDGEETYRSRALSRSPLFSDTRTRPQRKRNFSDIKFTPPQDLSMSCDLDDGRYSSEESSSSENEPWAEDRYGINKSE